MVVCIRANYVEIPNNLFKALLYLFMVSHCQINYVVRFLHWKYQTALSWLPRVARAILKDYSVFLIDMSANFYSGLEFKALEPRMRPTAYAIIDELPDWTSIAVDENGGKGIVVSGGGRKISEIHLTKYATHFG